MSVPLGELQALLNTIEPSGRFIALPGEDPTTAVISLASFFGRTFEYPTLTDPDVQGPVSELLIATIVFDAVLGRVEVAVLAEYTEEPSLLNDVVGAQIRRPAEFQWEIKQKNKENRFKVKVKGVDGFSVQLQVTAPDVLGIRNVLDPFPFAWRYLSDGPGGAHPSFSLAAQRDLILVPPEAIVVSPGGILKLPDGDLSIVKVIGGIVFRLGEGFFELE